ncbi:MAG: dihydropyrimidine dehydrogenase, partial [Deltaproteobacteria bacterium]|nr:dihydropyrimidine dehydrogenase [Deltaproteobacteria bacterium]
MPDTAKPKKTTGIRVEMPCQPAAERIHNFNEVALGYTREMALEEAGRCLQCKKPLCVQGCPVEVEIRDFIAALADDKVEDAYSIIKRTNALPDICGRVCPQEYQCEVRCILG